MAAKWVDRLGNGLRQDNMDNAFQENLDDHVSQSDTLLALEKARVDWIVPETKTPTFVELFLSAGGVLIDCDESVPGSTMHCKKANDNCHCEVCMGVNDCPPAVSGNRE